MNRLTRGGTITRAGTFTRMRKRSGRNNCASGLVPGGTYPLVNLFLWNAGAAEQFRYDNGTEEWTGKGRHVYQYTYNSFASSSYSLVSQSQTLTPVGEGLATRD